MRATLPFFSWYLATISTPALAATAGSFADSGNTLVSAMMVSVHLPSLRFAAPELGCTRRCSWVTTRRFTSSTKPNRTLSKSTDMLLGAPSGQSSRWLYLNNALVILLKGHRNASGDRDGCADECVLLVWYASAKWVLRYVWRKRGCGSRREPWVTTQSRWILSIMGLHNTRLRRNEGHSRAEPVHERGYLQCDSMPMVR